MTFCKFLNPSNHKCYLQVSSATKKIRGLTFRLSSKDAWHGYCPHPSPTLDQLKDCFLYVSATKYFKCQTCIFYFAGSCLKKDISLPKMVCSFYVSTDLLHFFNLKLKQHLEEVMTIYTLDELHQLWLKFGEINVNVPDIDITTTESEQEKKDLQKKTEEVKTVTSKIVDGESELIRSLVHLLIDQALSYSQNHNGIVDSIKNVIKVVIKKYDCCGYETCHEAVREVNKVSKVIKVFQPKYINLNSSVIILSRIDSYKIVPCCPFEEALVKSSEIIAKVKDKEIKKVYEQYLHKLGV